MQQHAKFTRLDAQTGVFFERELTHVKAKTYDTRYPELVARKLIPLSNEASPGDDFIKYDSYTELGIAQIVANYAKDFPRADIKGTENVSPIRSLGASYGYSIQDIRAAAVKGMPLQQRKANAAKKAVLLKENRIGLLGDTEHNLVGLLNNANMSHVSLKTDGTGTVATWANSVKDSDKIVRDLNDLVKYVVTITKGVEAPDTLLLPPSYYAFLSTLRMQYSDMTALKFFLANSPSVKSVEVVPELETAGSGSVPRMMVYKRHPDYVTLEVPQDFEQFEPTLEGMEYVVACHSRCGGCIVYYPLAMAYTDDAGAV